MNDLALKATTERKSALSAEDVENTLRAICTHRAVSANETASTADGAATGRCVKARPGVCSHVTVARRSQTSHGDVATNGALDA